MLAAMSPPSSSSALDAPAPLPDIGLRAGLWRYRGDRYGLLVDEGRRRRDLAWTRVGSLGLAIVTDGDLAQEVLLDQAGRTTKSRGLRQFARPLLGDGLISADDPLHKRQRKLLAPGFQARRIARYAADMTSLAAQTVAGWRDGEPRDFALEMMRLTVAIAAKTMFGSSDMPADAIGAALEVANRWIIDQSTSILPLPLSWPTPRNRAMCAALAELDAVVYRLIRDRRHSGADRGDLLSMLLAAQHEDDATRMSDQQVRDEVMTFFMAGHETTATALAWMFHLLRKNPASLATLQRELDTVLGGRTPTHADLEQLPFTRQVVQETLRLYPTAYMIGRRATEPVTIGRHVVPAGSYVLVNVLGMHRRADVFADPDAFVPARFAPDAPAVARNAYIPFGIGPRVCIGNQFAIMEAMLLCAVLFQAVDPGADATDIEPEPLITLRPRNGIPFTVRRRAAVRA
jgi:cytochrome P450